MDPYAFIPFSAGPRYSLSYYHVYLKQTITNDSTLASLNFKCFDLLSIQKLHRTKLCDARAEDRHWQDIAQVSLSDRVPAMNIAKFNQNLVFH